LPDAWGNELKEDSDSCGGRLKCSVLLLDISPHYHTCSSSGHLTAIASKMVTAQVTLDQLPTLLANDTKVKVAGVDGDGLLRGKVISREKFLSVVQSGIGMSSAIFGWDMHDQLYTNDVPSELERKGFVDFLAFPDLNSFRRIPWEGNIPFFLLNFEQDGKSVPPCGRSMLRTTLKKLAALNCRAFAGGQ
jgi:glutamine synthetase